MTGSDGQQEREVDARDVPDEHWAWLLDALTGEPPHPQPAYDHDTERFE